MDSIGRVPPKHTHGHVKEKKMAFLKLPQRKFLLDLLSPSSMSPSNALIRWLSDSFRGFLSLLVGCSSTVVFSISVDTNSGHLVCNDCGPWFTNVWTQRCFCTNVMRVFVRCLGSNVQPYTSEKTVTFNPVSSFSYPTVIWYLCKTKFLEALSQVFISAELCFKIPPLKLSYICLSV